MGLEEAIRQLDRDLRAAKIEFALVGGLAVSTRAEPRLTRDADVAVSVRNDQEAEETVRQLAGYGYSSSVFLEQEAVDRLATVRLVHRDRSDVVVDVLFASSGIEPEIVEHAERLEVLPDLVLPVARTGHLIAMKLLARDDRNRPTDADDLLALSAIATGEEWVYAESAVRLITARGFNRQRDLAEALAELKASWTQNEPGSSN